MPEIMDWTSGDNQDVLGRALAHVARGSLLALPTEGECLLVASALHGEAVARLEPWAANQRLAVLLGHPAEALDWLPYLPGLGVRLARRFWPGPLVLVSGAGGRQGLAACLPDEVRRRLTRDDLVALRSPEHPAARGVAALSGVPLVAVAPQWASTAAGIAALPQDVLVLRDANVPHQQRATVVRVDRKQWSVEQEGLVSAHEIEAQTACQILFVCTGNTCRSPMAQGLCEKLLAERLGCAPAELASHGFRVHSAGLAAMMGGAATPEAVEAAGRLGADLTEHRSQPLTMDLLTRADFMFTMTWGHLRMLQGLPVGPVARLLSARGEDIADPIGGSDAIYQECARKIEACLEDLMPELQEG